MQVTVPCFLAAADDEHEASAPAAEGTLVLPGQTVTTLAGYMRGYGTHSPDAGPTLTATVSGRVLRVNKLLGVTAFRARYKGDVGDVVVARIVDVQQKRWKLDLGASQHAVLMLSSINLPGGVLRRRTDLDALQMRRYFVEGDLVSSEVQQFFGCARQVCACVCVRLTWTVQRWCYVSAHALAQGLFVAGRVRCNPCFARCSQCFAR